MLGAHLSFAALNSALCARHEFGCDSREARDDHAQGYAARPTHPRSERTLLKRIDALTMRVSTRTSCSLAIALRQLLPSLPSTAFIRPSATAALPLHLAPSAGAITPCVILMREHSSHLLRAIAAAIAFANQGLCRPFACALSLFARSFASICSTPIHTYINEFLLKKRISVAKRS